MTGVDDRGPAAAGRADEDTVRLAHLAAFALRLTRARDLDDVARCLRGEGLPVLGAVGCGVVARGDDGDWHLALASSFDERLRTRFAVEPFDSPLPACRSAREGHRFLVASREEAWAFHPSMGGVVDETGRPRWALLPLVAGGENLGSLAISWEREAPFGAEELDLLDAFAAHCAPTLERVLAARTQRRAARAVREMALLLQRRALAPLPAPGEGSGAPGIAVRYRPAAREAEIGGDWYDAFVRHDGDLVLVVGDITGHDLGAAAAMSQVRTLLRGVGWHAAHGPARVLDRLDAVVQALEPGTLATAVLATVGRPSAAGDRAVRWASAGHVPPLLRFPDGGVRVLEDGSDVLLGVAPETSRREHHVDLPPGSCLVLYSDGLVEQRGSDLGAGIQRLVGALREVGTADPEVVADALLAAAGTPTRSVRATPGEDDVTVLVLTATPAPAAAGVGAEVVERPGVAPAPATVSRVVVLPPTPAAARQARHAVEGVCAEDGWDAERSDTAVLLTSELVTNAVVHGRSETRVTVTSAPDRLEVHVEDENHRVPERLSTDDGALSGRGLLMVEVAASAWGVRPRPGLPGKDVWFSLSRP